MGIRIIMWKMKWSSEYPK